MHKLIVITILTIILSGCGKKTDEEVRYDAIDQRTVRFLDRAEAGLKPCLDSISNKNSSDMTVAINCQTAALLYRKYGGRPHLEPLPLTLLKDSDKIRATKLVDNLDLVDARFAEIEEKYSDNLYFNQVLSTQAFAHEAADSATNKMDQAKEVDSN